jgi:esterase/lipase superfamily enzyme
MLEARAMSREEFLAAVAERLGSSRNFKDHAVVFVHGYNTGFNSAVYRTAQIAYDLKFDGVPFLFSWPSVGKMASYTYDRESARQSEPFLREFLQLVVRETGAKSVSIIAHSMGNEPLLQVLKDLKSSAPKNVSINQVILAAPDVDRDTFENFAKAIAGVAHGLTLYVAANDRALTVSRRFHGGVPRAGDVPPSGPLVVPGIDTIDVTAAGMDSVGLNHSSYAESNALLNDIGLLIQTGERPPDKRIPILQRIKTVKGADYWRYPSIR